MRDAVEIDFTSSRRSLVYKFGIRIGGCAVKAAPRICLRRRGMHLYPAAV